MVKPPKTMQPESVDLTKAGRKSGRAFQADSFHHYMARKIDLQRNQFGLILPPPPQKTAGSSKSNSSPTKPTASPSPSRPFSSPSSAGGTGTNSRKRPRPGSSNGATKSVSFAALPLRAKEVELDGDDDDAEEEEESSLQGMSAILKNLKRRHGWGCRRVLSRHGKRRSRPHKHVKCTHHYLEPPAHQETPQESSSSPFKTLKQSDSSAGRIEDGDHQSTIQQADEASFQVQVPDIANSPINCTTTTSDSEEVPTPSYTLKLRRERPDLFFLGVVVKVQGYTDPDNETIKRLLQRYGGDFETYETSRVTHIVAEHLSTAKANYLKRQRRPRPVVLPSWIMDSVQAGKLLPHGDYLLEELQDNPPSPGGRQIGIKDLFSMTKKKEITSPPKSSSSVDEHRGILPTIAAAAASGKALERQDSSSSMEVDVTEESSSCAESGGDIIPLTQVGRMSDDDGEGEDEDNRSVNMAEESIGIPVDCSQEEKSNDPIDDETMHRDVITGKTGATTERRQGKTDGKFINGMIRTVGTDPNFLDSFFANSRLSFIGSYKQRTKNEKSGTVASPQGKYAKSSGYCKRFVFHIDMDCFFANVVLRNYPQYRDKPVAISHHGKKHDTGSAMLPRPDTDPMSLSEKSTSECATCNYHARKFGIQKGMFLGRARQLCPELIVLHYDFAGYEEVSEQVLAILQRVAAEHEGCVEAVSCDEAFMELYLPLANEDGVMSGDSSTANNQASDIADAVRKEIVETTKCTASIGVATNKFLAKVGTDRVKPNGTFVVTDYRKVIEDLRLGDLHGVGYRSEPKLLAEGLSSVQDVWDLGSKAESILSRILGPCLGKKIYAFCHGRDDRAVKPAERKTIGAECNYGVRFDGPYGIEHFMQGLATEVEKRMYGVGCKGCKLTLKVKQRKKGAKPPPKFLGHGSCHNLSKSMNVPGSVPTRDAKVLKEVGMTLFGELGVLLDDVRGMGMVMSKLTPNDGRNQSPNKDLARAGIATFFEHASKQNSDATLPRKKVSSKKNTEDVQSDSTGDRSGHIPEPSNEGVPVKSSIFDEDIPEEARVDAVPEGSLALPPLSQICMSQVLKLPSEMQEEIYSRFACLERKQSVSSNTAPVELIDVDEIHRATMELPSTSGKESQLPKCTFGHERHHFRQTSLKRMMKLAAVKSGQARPEMSLTELQHLPLEIQLQIANQDSDPVGMLSQKPRSSSHGNFTRSRQAFKHETGVQRAAAGKQAPGRVHGIDLTNERDDETNDAEENQAQTHDEADRGVKPRTDLFDDDILPLHRFLDRNSPYNAEAIHTVGDFLRTCLEERRMNVIPPLVRSIKKRTDEWGKRCFLLQVLRGLDDEHERKYRNRLDIDWLLRD